MAFRFTINGVDFRPYLPHGGIDFNKRKISDVITTMDGADHYGKITEKTDLEVSLRPLNSSEYATVYGILKNNIVSVFWEDPTGSWTKQMYCEEVPANHMMMDSSGNDWWEGVSFTLQDVKGSNQ